MIFYSHDTALEFWRRQAILEKGLDYPACPKSPCQFAFPSRKDAVASLPAGLPPLAEIHVSAGLDGPKRSSGQVRFHQSTLEFPKGSYRSIARGCAIAAPELAFLQMTASLSLREAVALGDSLCSDFAKVDSEIDMRGFRAVERLCSVKGICGQLSKAAGSHGSVTARKAVRYIVDGAASPRELELAMMLAMPAKEGGYGLPRPQLNAQIELDSLQQRALGKSHVVADMLWPDKKVAVEYDSDRWHTGTERISQDSKRRNLLKSMGFEVITVTNAEIKNLRALDVAVDGLRRCLGLRNRVAIQGYEARKRDLHKWVLTL